MPSRWSDSPGRKVTFFVTASLFLANLGLLAFSFYAGHPDWISFLSVTVGIGLGVALGAWLRFLISAGVFGSVTFLVLLWNHWQPFAVASTFALVTLAVTLPIFLLIALGRVTPRSPSARQQEDIAA